jgi:hypothetical protein
LNPDIQNIYNILVDWAENAGPQPYKKLSEDYQNLTGQWYEPHGSWDKSLGEINTRLSAIGAPAITSLVILKGKNEPGGNFWGCADNVPQKPMNDSERISTWLEIVKEVKGYDWPTTLP